MDSTDEELVRLLAEDVDKYFYIIVERYTARLRGYCYKFVERDATDDMVQQTMYKAFAALRKYPRERILELELPAWLLTIARNECFTELKRRKRESFVGPLDDQSGGQPAVTSINAWRLIETNMDLSEAIQALPLLYREPVRLHFIEDLKIREIAAKLGRPEGTIKNQLSRARRYLRETLDGLPPGKANKGDRNDA